MHAWHARSLLPHCLSQISWKLHASSTVPLGCTETEHPRGRESEGKKERKKRKKNPKVAVITAGARAKSKLRVCTGDTAAGSSGPPPRVRPAPLRPVPGEAAAGAAPSRAPGPGAPRGCGRPRAQHGGAAPEAAAAAPTRGRTRLRPARPTTAAPARQHRAGLSQAEPSRAGPGAFLPTVRPTEAGARVASSFTPGRAGQEPPSRGSAPHTHTHTHTRGGKYRHSPACPEPSTGSRPGERAERETETGGQPPPAPRRHGPGPALPAPRSAHGPRTHLRVARPAPPRRKATVVLPGPVSVPSPVPGPGPLLPVALGTPQPSRCPSVQRPLAKGTGVVLVLRAQGWG